MASYTIENGDIVTVNTDNWPDLVEDVNVKDGVLNFVNDTDDIKLLKMDAITIYVTSFGSFNISGKLVKIADGNGELGQTIDLPITGHSIGGLFIKNPDTGEIEKWRNINGGALDYTYTDFAKNGESGRVFKIEDDIIKFTDTEDGGIAPYDGAEIYMQNIVLSTKDGDSESSYAKFASGLGGIISLNNVAVSNFSGTYSDINNLMLLNSTFLRPINCYYISSGKISNIVISNNSNYASGFSSSYIKDIMILDIVAQSVKSYGINVAYTNNVSFDKIVGILIARDSSSDAAIYFNTVQDFKATETTNIGGMFYFKNSSAGNVENVKSINSVLQAHSSSYSQPNIKVDSSSNITFKTITIPSGGASYDSYINVLNSNKIDLIGLDADDDYANYLIRCDVAYDCKFVDVRCIDTRSDDVVRMDNKSDKLLLQNARTDVKKTFRIYSKDTLVKGIYSDGVDIYQGAINTTLFQIYDDDGKGKLLINFVQNDNMKVIDGKPKLDYKSGILLKSGDVIEYKSQFVLRGITFDDVAPDIDLSNDKVRVLFSVKTANDNTDYQVLNKDNIQTVNDIIDGNSFTLKIKIDAIDLDDDEVATLKTITINTKDDKFKYPIYYKDINIVFDNLMLADPDAMFSLMYKNNYDLGNGVILTDKDGNPITGRVGTEKIKTFQYDYEYNNESARTPNEPFDVVLVVAGKNITEPFISYGEITSDLEATFNVTSRPDKAAAIVLSMNS